MRLAAIYIEEHEYLFDKPQTINFGGEYFYEFIKETDGIIVAREKNDQFIEGLFDLNGLDSEVTHLNAIVGQNGSGKSTILDVIRSVFINNENALALSNALILVEGENKDQPLILKNNLGDEIYFKVEDKIKRLSNEIKSSTQTIYYSPHFDYKYNPNFDDIDDHDISFDKLLEKDLGQLDEKDLNQNGFPYSPSQELLFKNSLRQLKFLSSDLVSNQQIFKEIFQLPDHQEPLLEFRGYKKRDEYRNTPYPFRNAMELVKEKTEKELDNWTEIRKIEEGKVVNQLEVDKYILKRNLINCAMSLIQKVMERNNSFLNEGVFPSGKLEEMEEAEAYEAFLIFIYNCSLQFGSSKTKKVFKDEILEKLFAKLYGVIDEANDPSDISRTSLKTTMDNAIEILSLQRSLTNKLSSYYYTFNKEKDEPTYSDMDKIDGFINYMPFEKRLSSGEHALLNLFSRLYDFLNTNLKVNKYRELKDHYILLLDEADLSFHPTWKKKFVKSILSTLPYFFDELETHPSLQIIFTTHDPLSLSDLPNSNVIYIERKSYDEQPEILPYKNENRPDKTFGANISELISDSFFINDSLVGNFVSDLIREAINWLETDNKDEKSDYYQKLINLIDEPIVKRKLAEMFDNKMPNKKRVDSYKRRIEKLESAIRKLEE